MRFANLAAFVVAASAFTVHAQAPPPTFLDNILNTSSPVGLPPTASSEGTSEQVSLSSGSLNIFIPAVSLPQRGGHPLILGFRYDSNQSTLQQNINVTTGVDGTETYNYDDYTYWETLGTSNPWSPFLQVNLPILKASFEYEGDGSFYTPGETPTGEFVYPEFCLTNFSFTDWGGATHQFTHAATSCSTAYLNGNGGGQPVTEWHVDDSNDQQYYLLKINIHPSPTTGQLLTTFTITAPDGVIYTWPDLLIPQTTTSPLTNATELSENIEQYLNFPPATITDPNGNVISISGWSSLTGPYIITDTLDRHVTVSPNGDAAGNVASISYSDSNGAAQTVSLSPGTFQATSTPDVGTGLYTNTCSLIPAQLSIPAPQYYLFPVTLSGPSPTGLAGTFSLAFSGTNKVYTLQTDSYGHLVKIAYPNGGYTRYKYQVKPYAQVSGPISCAWGLVQVAEKDECANASGSCGSETTTLYDSNNIPIINGVNLCNVSGSETGSLALNFADYANLFNAVTDPLGQKAVHCFSQAMYPMFPIELDNYVYSAAGTQLRHVNTSPTLDGWPQRVTTTLSDANPALSSYTTYVYDTYTDIPAGTNLCCDGPVDIQNATQIDQYDFSNTHILSTTQSWNYTNHVLNALSNSTTTDEVSGVSKTLGYSYDGLGNRTQTAVGSSNTGTSTTLYTPLDAYGRPTQITDPLGNITKIGYTDNWGNNSCGIGTNVGAYPTSMTKVLASGNQTTSYSYNDCTGTIASQTDANGQTWGYHYDAIGRVTDSCTPDALGILWQGLSCTAGSGSLRTVFTDTAPSSVVDTEMAATPIVSSVVYDGYGRPVSTSKGSTSPVIVDTSYDALGRVQSVSNPHLSSPSSSDGQTSYSYDALNRKLFQCQPDNATTSSTTCAPSASYLEWDHAGNVITSFDESRNQWQRTTDFLGRLTNVTELGSASIPLYLRTAYAYDGFGDLTSVVQDGAGAVAGDTTRSRSFQYDGLSRLLTASNPETGTICYGQWSGGSCSGGYDANGNLLYKTDARSIVTTYAYDTLNRLVSKTYSDGTTAGIYFAYDGSDTSGYSLGVSNAFGRLSDAVRSGTEFVYSYDPVGRLKWQQDCIPGNCFVDYGSGVKYDLAGNMTDLFYPDGRHIQQAFDAAGRLSASNLIDISGSPISESYLQSVTYFPDGSPSVMTLGSGVQQIQQTVGKNNRLQVQSISVASPSLSSPFNGHPYLWHTYCYVGCATGGADNNGNIWGITDILNSGNTQGFTYDSLNRLSSFSLGTLNQGFAVDSFGNMSPTAMWFANGPNRTVHLPLYTFDPATNRISNLPCASSVSFPPYDPAGNQSCSTDEYGGISKYSYDAENRISKISTLNSPAAPFVSYTYDADGTRVLKSNADGTSTGYVNFNGQIVAEIDQSNNWTDYIYAGGKEIARVAQAVPMIHFFGSNPQSGVECGTGLSLGLNYPIQSGDKLSWLEYKSNAIGGIMQWFDNTTIGDQWQAVDTNGSVVNADTRENRWVTRTFDMSNYAGHILSSLGALKDSSTPAGSWDIWYSDIAIVSLNGTVTSLFGSSGTASIYATECQGSGTSNVEIQSVSTAPSIPDSGADTHFYLADHLGTAQLEFSSGGWPIWQSQFAPYGQQIQNGIPLPPDQTDASINHYKFTGKERDAESGLDYFGARYYGSGMGRFMSPDPIKMTDERLLNPANTLNLYSYAANNPLKYVDPDGQDVTYFYDQGGIAGHAVLFAYNQQTGDSAIESFGPVVHAPIAAGQSMFDMSSLHSADDVRSTYASLTIQTSPELAQQVIAYIRANPDPSTWTALGPNCSTQCIKILQKFKLANQKDSGLRPKLLWNTLRQQYNPNAPANPKNGTDYGQPRTDMFNALWLSLPQAPKDNSSVTTSQHDNLPCGGQGDPKCQ